MASAMVTNPTASGNANQNKEIQPHSDAKLFNRWSFDDVQVSDMSVMDYIAFSAANGRREDATRIDSARVVRRQAVDISLLRRVDQPIYLLTTGARESAFRNIKTIYSRMSG